MQNQTVTTAPILMNHSISAKPHPMLVESHVLETQADVIVSYLHHIGVDVVFGVPGGAIEPLFNALARSERAGGPRLVIARHECGAAFMADGYYRETGKMGVVCSTTGPGATNLLTGVASALTENIPMLVLTAQTPLPKFGKRALQESSCTAIDTVSLFGNVTVYNTLVSHADQLESKLISAVMAAHRHSKGPVHLSIPSDVLRSPVSQTIAFNETLLTRAFPMCDEVATFNLCRRIEHANNIVVYVGDGVAEASHQVMEFIERTNALFVCSPVGKTFVNEKHKNFRGVFGFAGHDSAKDLLRNTKVDLIMAVGTSMDELSTSGWSADIINSKLVHIDSNPEHFTRSTIANMHVLGTIATIFNRLNSCVKNLVASGVSWAIVDNKTPAIKEIQKCVEHSSPIKPQSLFHSLSAMLPSDTRIHIDAGNSWSWATHYMSSADVEGRYRIAMGFGSMAWSIGAAIGSAIAAPKSPTVCIVGDGSYLMSAQEISVAVQEELPIVFVVLNDSALGMVMHGQRMGKQESIGWELNEIDFAAQATAMGARGIIVRSTDELLQIDIVGLFKLNGPTLIDVRIDREEVPPMGDRVKGISVNASSTPGG